METSLSNTNNVAPTNLLEKSIKQYILDCISATIPNKMHKIPDKRKNIVNMGRGVSIKETFLKIFNQIA